MRQRAGRRELDVDTTVDAARLEACTTSREEG